MGKLFIILILLITLCDSVTCAKHAVLRPMRDATLFEDLQGETASGSGSSLFIGRTQTHGIRRALLEFDFSNIPETAVVLSASLSLTVQRHSGSSWNVSVHHVVQPWGEGTSSATGGEGTQAQRFDATWLHTYYSTTYWNRPGGDFLERNSAEVPATPDKVVIPATESMLHDIGTWISGDNNNVGWILLGNEAVEGDTLRIASREAEEGQPELAVTYETDFTPTIPPSTPQPIAPTSIPATPAEPSPALTSSTTMPTELPTRSSTLPPEPPISPVEPAQGISSSNPSGISSTGLILLIVFIIIVALIIIVGLVIYVFILRKNLSKAKEENNMTEHVID